MTSLHYYTQITANCANMEYVGLLLGCACRDNQVSLNDYRYLSTVAKSLGLTFYIYFLL
jgi:copper homeostasis protein CutC